MQQSKTEALICLVRQGQEYLRCSPGARSITYLAMAAATLEVVWRVHRPTGPYAAVGLHLQAIPFVAALTYGYVRLRPQDRERWSRVPVRQGLGRTLQGIGFGAGSFLIWMGIAATKGWVSVPAWGWEHTSVLAVARSVALLAVGDLAVVWNEEMVFRGYGFETLQMAVGQGAAAGILIGLFAIYHGLEPQQLLGMAAGGMTLTLLRLKSNGIWLPIGYHWSWNVLQTAIFGPPDGAISVRPLHLHGPPLWLGRPGHPEPGLLSTLIMLVVGLFVWVWIRRTSATGHTMRAI